MLLERLVMPCLHKFASHHRNLQSDSIRAKLLHSSLSTTLEQIWPVNGLTRFVRLVRPVQVVKQWFTSRTGRGAMVTCISLVRQLVYIDSTTRTGRTGRATMVYESHNWWIVYAWIPQSARYDEYFRSQSVGANNNKLKFIPRSFYKNIQLRLTINIKLKVT